MSPRGDRSRGLPSSEGGIQATLVYARNQQWCDCGVCVNQHEHCRPASPAWLPPSSRGSSANENHVCSPAFRPSPAGR